MGAQIPATSDVYRELKTAIGQDAARKLIEKLGGQRIKVAKKMAPDHEVVQAIGEESARKLAYYFHGIHLQLPVLAAPLRRQRVRELGEEGDLTRRQIVGETGYSERQVYRILGDKRERRQGDLFGDDGGDDE